MGIRGRRQYSYYLGTREFELAELKFLVDTIYSSHFATFKKTKLMVQKIGRLTSKTRAKELNRQVRVTGCIKSPNEKIFYSLDVIHMAMRENRKMKFHYYKWNLDKELEIRNNGEFYYVSPYTLVFDRENYYLVAYEGRTGIIKHFRVDKMMDACLLDEKRDIRKDLMQKSVGDYHSMYFGMYAGKDEKVTILFHNNLIGVVIDKFGRDVKIKRMDPSHFTIKVTVSISDNFFGWVCSYRNQVKILGPDWVIKEFGDFRSAVDGQYEK